MGNVTGFVKTSLDGYSIVYKGREIEMKPFTEGQYIITTELTYEMTQSREDFRGFMKYLDTLRDFVDEYELEDLDSDFDTLDDQDVFNINVYLSQKDVDKIHQDFMNPGKVPAPTGKKYYFIKLIWTQEIDHNPTVTKTTEIIRIIEVDKGANMIQAYEQEADKLLRRHTPSSVKLVDIRRL